MLHKHIAKHVSRFHAHIQEHGHKRALVMIMSSMVMMFYPYFSTRADLLPSGGTITVQYSPDNLVDVNTDVVATVVHNSASGVIFAESDTFTFTANGTHVFEYSEDGVTGAITANVDWIDKDAPTAWISIQTDPNDPNDPMIATLEPSEDVTITNNGGLDQYTFTTNGTFTFEFMDEAGNTGSATETISSIGIPEDVCPNGDYSASGTDGDCGENQCSNIGDLNPSHTISNDQVTLNWNDFLNSGYYYSIEILDANTQEDFPIATSVGIVPMSDETYTFQLPVSGLYRISFVVTDVNGDQIENSAGSSGICPAYGYYVAYDWNPTATVVYSTNASGYVIATLTGFNGSLIEVENNYGSYNYVFTSPGSFTFDLIRGTSTGSVNATATTGMFTTGTTPPTPTLTGITASVSYASGTTVTATATGFNMAGVFAVNNSNSLTHTFTSPGSFTFALQTAGGNTGSVTATATTGMFTTGSTNTGTTTPPPSTGTVNTGVVCDAGDLVLTGALGGVYSLTTPVVIGGLFSINWAAANNHCNPDQIVTVQLRDHNGQWITLGTGELDGTGVSFRSTGLAYTGLYSIFGTHASGTVYSYTGTSGQQLTGAYTVDTPYTIYTGSYTGAYTGLWTGYQLRILSASGVDLLSGARPFTIDNTTPSLTGLALLISGANGSGVVGSGGTFTLSFVGSELLSNIQLLVNNTLVKSWTGGSSTGYSFTGGFGATNLAGPIAYTVNFTDAAGNTGSITGTNIYTIDTVDPNFQAFAVTGTAASGVKFSWNTSKNSVYNFQFSLSGSTGVVVPVTTNAYATSHNYTTTALATGKTYMFSIKINDALQNTNFMSGTVAVNASGAASVTIATQNNNVLQLSSQVEAKLFSQILKEEIKKFESCKSDLKFKSTSIELKGTKSINLKIPEMEKSSTKTIVQAFSLMLVNKLKTSNLSASELDETETKVNNFFVILKLLKDDKGDCKQNLSAYYINQFERIMEDMLK